MNDYSCLQCSAVVMCDVARQTHYRCPNCQLGYLVARSHEAVSGLHQSATPASNDLPVDAEANREAMEPLPLQDETSPVEIVAVVLPPLQNEKDATAMEQLAGTLARLPSSVALEIAGDHHQRRLLIRGAPQAVRRIAAQLYAVYRQV